MFCMCNCTLSGFYLCCKWCSLGLLAVVVAIYHLSIKHGSKGKNQSAGAHSRYIQREEKYSYNSDELRHVEHGNLPDWAHSGTHFWDMADTYSRSNARVYSELGAALPRELSKEAQVKLVQEFAGEVIGERHPYTLVVHESPATDGGTHPHVHLMFSARTIDGIDRDERLFFRPANGKAPEKGGAPKDRDWIYKAKLERIRETWEHCTNRALKRAGVDAVVDRRTLAEQGIDRKPQPRLTPFESMLRRQGIETPKGAEIKLLQEIAKVQAGERFLQEQRFVLKAVQELVEARTQAEDLLERELKELKAIQFQQETADRTVEKFTAQLYESEKSHSRNVGVALSRVYGRALGSYREEVENASEVAKRQREKVQGSAREPGRSVWGVKQLALDLAGYIEASGELANAKERLQGLEDELSSAEVRDLLHGMGTKITQERAETEAVRNKALEDALTLRESLTARQEVTEGLEEIIQGLNDEIDREVQRLAPSVQQWFTSDAQQIEIGQEAKVSADEANKAKAQASVLQHELSLDFSFS